MGMKRVLLILLAVVIALSAAVGFYVNDYYRADAGAVEAMTADAAYTFGIWGDGTRAYYPEDREYTCAVIFYPGGKVEYSAYEPLMAACAERGILCLLVQMPGNLAVLDMDAAARVREFYPDVEHWYMAGHSLGGSMAASFAAETDWVEGLILLAAYSTENVTDLPTLSVYGSEDGVLNREKYEQYRTNLPENFAEHIIEGGNHAYFGVYGEQEGDGAASISNAEQIEQTATLIAEFVK